MGSAADQTPHKKVRLACRRCRAKRIKCDGRIPACSHCAKVAVACVDVDSRDNGRSIPRDYAARCHARIQWLEQQIKLLDADFDLSQGPQLVPRTSDETNLSVVESPLLAQPAAFDGLQNSRKRPHAAINASGSPQISDPTPAAEARSVAMDLGMLSLHSDSRQKHYLGSSSGLFFTNLIGAHADALSSPSSMVTGPLQNHRSRSRPSDTQYSLYRTLSKELPSPEEAITLIDVYLKEIHIDHPLLHPASVLEAYGALRLCVEQGLEHTRNLDANGWPDDMPPFSYNGRYDKCGEKDITPISIFTAVLHVFMVFSLAATVLTRNKNFDFSPTRFYKVAAGAAPECLSSISLSALQSVLLFTIKGMMTPTNLNIWTLIHVATSHCIDLGLHREPRDVLDMTSTSLLTRRFVFYMVYDLDRSISTIQGRPLELADIPREPVTMTHNLSCVSSQLSNDMVLPIYRFKLDRHISEIKILFYHLPTKGEQARIRASLDEWLTELKQLWLNSDLDLQNPDGAAKSRLKRLRLEVLYHGAITLLYQPSQAYPSPTHSALLQCYRSSSERIRIYNHLNNEETLYYNWRNIHGIFSSGATIVYCLWASPQIQLVIPFAEALRDLRVCSNLLSVGGQWWPSVRGGRDNFDRIVDLTIKQLSRQRTEASPEGRQVRFRDNHSDETSAFDHEPNGNTEWMPSEPLVPQMAGSGSQDQLANDIIAPHEFPFEARYPDEAGATPVDAVMENFFADFLHGDWGWDPFSTCLDTSIL
ncbi:uncharacterized protein BDV14DRAFT_190913 [Aspergillus stella-maris]|uniref:uncharacterized protein n=1 Tax=Aspergillus stella-maris TaxID=1810926 RepID=UPI003CCDDA25